MHTAIAGPSQHGRVSFSAYTQQVHRLLPLLLICCSLGTSAIEISCGLALLAVLATWRRPPAALLHPFLAVSTLSLVAALGGDLLGGLRVAWMLCLVIVVPQLPGDRVLAARWGTGAAAWMAVGAALQALWSGALPASGPFSHHLTLGYALLPAFAVALYQGWWWRALACGLGVALTLSLGPALGLAVAVTAVRLSPRAALLGGAAVALLAITMMRGSPELGERAILWASSAEVLLQSPLGVGPGSDRAALAMAQHALEPSFYFPFHAHDSLLQIGVEVGWAGWLAWAWLLLALWQHATVPGRAGLAAVLIGGLTQDTLGDLEVCRTMCAWALLQEPDARRLVGSDREPTQVRSES